VALNFIADSGAIKLTKDQEGYACSRPRATQALMLACTFTLSGNGITLAGTTAVTDANGSRLL
jgi:hypothetical protein